MTVERDPRRLGSVLSVVAGAVAVWLVTPTAAQRTALWVALGGLVGLGVGIRLSRRGHGLVGWLLVTVGATGFFGAFARSWSAPLADRVELYPALVGLGLVTVGLGPIRWDRERGLVTAGTGLVFLTVLASGVFRSAGTLALLAAGVATVAAWDFGEQAVNLSRHVGREARGSRVELVHGGVGLLVGGLAVGAALLVESLDVTDVPLAGLGLLLGAAVVLTAALYN